MQFKLAGFQPKSVLSFSIQKWPDYLLSIGSDAAVQPAVYLLILEPRKGKIWEENWETRTISKIERPSDKKIPLYGLLPKRFKGKEVLPLLPSNKRTETFDTKPFFRFFKAIRLQRWTYPKIFSKNFQQPKLLSEVQSLNFFYFLKMVLWMI